MPNCKIRLENNFENVFLGIYKFKTIRTLKIKTGVQKQSNLDSKMTAKVIEELKSIVNF